MSSYVSVQQVLDVVSPTFQSVDVRTLAFSFDEGPCNVVTAVGFHDQPAATVEAAIEALINLHADFGDRRLQFCFRVVPCERWPELVEEFRSGVIDFEGERVNLMRPVEIAESKGYIERINFLRGPLDWPVFESRLTLSPGQNIQASATQRIRLVQHDQDLLRNLSANGYRSLTEVLQIFFQSRPDGEPSYESDIYVAIPIFAAIRRLRFHPKERCLLASFDCHADLQENIRVFGERTFFPRGDERLLFSNPERETGDSWIASAPLDLGDATAGVNVRLGHGELGIITSRNATLREILPPEEINPLWRLFQVFCPSERFETLLTTPPKPNDKRQKEQRCFEQHVAWLLALHGFSVVVLGEFETLRAAGSPVQQGSLDILAYHKARNSVLMCSCTLAPPEERDYGNLVSVRSHLLSCVGPNISFTTELAIFSSAAECVPPTQYTNQGSYVAVFDRRDLKRSLDNLDAGIDMQFFDKLDGAQLSIGWDDFPRIDDTCQFFS